MARKQAKQPNAKSYPICKKHTRTLPISCKQALNAARLFRHPGGMEKQSLIRRTLSSWRARRSRTARPPSAAFATPAAGPGLQAACRLWRRWSPVPDPSGVPAY